MARLDLILAASSASALAVVTALRLCRWRLPRPSPIAVKKVQIIDQTKGSPFKKAADEDWRSICGEEYPACGIEPCGFVAMVVAAEPVVPRSSAEVAELSRRLSSLDYMRPKVRALMREVVASRRAYFDNAKSGQNNLMERYVRGKKKNAAHPIVGWVGQWEIAARLASAKPATTTKATKSAPPPHFLRNIKVGVATDFGDGCPPVVLDATEEDFWKGALAEGALDSPNVRQWMAEERPFRADDGSALHFVQRGSDLLSLDEWSATASSDMMSDGFAIVVDGQGHFWCYMCTAIDGVPTILRLDSLNNDPVSEPCVESLQSVLGGGTGTGR